MTENSYNGVSLRLVGVIKYHKSKKGVWGSFLPWNDIWWLWNDIWWRVTTQIWVVLLTGWSRFPTNKKHYPVPGSGTSSLWNFCARFSDVISRETTRDVAKCPLFSQATFFGSNIWIKTFWRQSFYFYLIYSKQQYQAMFTLYLISDTTGIAWTATAQN